MSVTINDGLNAAISWVTCESVERNHDIASGAWVFKGTRVPVTALFENLSDGATIDQFLSWFPGVTREQVEDVKGLAGMQDVEFEDAAFVHAIEKGLQSAEAGRNEVYAIIKGQLERH